MKKVFIVNILMILLILASIEAALRIFINITPQGLSEGVIDNTNIPVFNFPNVRGKKVFGKKVYTDDNGFRVEKKSEITKSENLDKIYFVGGSVTFGGGVKQSDTFSGIINKEKKNLKAINASVIGSNLKNNLAIIKEKIEYNDLKYVVVNFSLDDLLGLEEITNDNQFTSDKQNDLISKLKKNFILVSINNFTRSKSVIYVMFKGAVLNANKRYYQHALNTFKNEANIKYLKILMNLFSEKNKSLNKKIVFIMIPYNYQISDENCSKKDLAEKIIEDNILSKEMKLIKLKKVFCENKEKDKIFFKYDPSHLSSYGHKVAAEFLKKELD